MEVNYYMITCSEERWANYKGFDWLNKKNAVDTRELGIKVAKERGFNVNILKKYKRHFNYCKGAYGCFLSHYDIWNEIYFRYKNDHTNVWSVILEDDVCDMSLRKFKESSENKKLFKGNRIVNLRCGTGAWGSEAYMLPSKLCSTIIGYIGDIIHSPVDKFLFMGEKPWRKTKSMCLIPQATWAQQSSLRK